MAPLDGNQEVDIAQLVFFVPALGLSAYLCFKHGFGRMFAWFLMVMLSVARILGASFDIAARQGSGSVVSLETGAIILSSLGVSLMVSSLLSLIIRINEGMRDKAVIHPRMFKLLHNAILAGIIVGIVGGTNQSNFNDPSSVSTGRTESKVALVLFLVVFVAVVGATAITFPRLEYVLRSERTLYYGVVAALPFLLVRLVYSLISVFDPTSTVFNHYHPNIWARAFMAVMIEFIFVIILTFIGFVTPRVERKELQQSRGVSILGIPLGGRGGQRDVETAYYQGPNYSRG